ncbi:uncharacterized protein LOC130773176 [Actinidia eriantha]|uniref:uncharacterized protein LOC130773176 n=1 Tax=Actinidia eriantha TaxID=165200 RepID=UPI0025901D5B|nr:uncharacterized protein LOC130773176 [Actinidia eriantha]
MCQLGYRSAIVSLPSVAPDHHHNSLSNLNPTLSFSTILAFSCRSVQDGKNPHGNDYSLQPQLDRGGFHDHSHLILINGVGTNSCKRGRVLTETASSAHRPPLSFTHHNKMWCPLVFQKWFIRFNLCFDCQVSSVSPHS